MAKWVCKVCGYVHEGDSAPEQCPICKVPASQFTKLEESGSKYAGTKT
ncbi:MAG: NADH peroxidase, partial [Oscillospiraceae bacterium]